jgi:hypothetical protein
VRPLRVLLSGLALAAAFAPGAAAAAPPESTTVPPADPASTTTTVASTVPAFDPALMQIPPPILDPRPATAPLVVVPAGCNAPPAPTAVFVAVIVAEDATTARYAVEQIRAGSLDGYAVGTMVDVRYDDDIRFLRSGQRYLVGVAPDPLTGVLRSKVRLEAPLFGGDAVIGINDTDVACPRIEDGVKTLHVDGTTVDTGVLAPLKTAKRTLLRAVLKPLGIAIGVLVCLTAIKLLIFAMVRALRVSAADDDDLPPLYEAPRDRQHLEDDAAGVGSPPAVSAMGERP